MRKKVFAVAVLLLGMVLCVAPGAWADLVTLSGPSQITIQEVPGSYIFDFFLTNNSGAPITAEGITINSLTLSNVIGDPLDQPNGMGWSSFPCPIGTSVPNGGSCTYTFSLVVFQDLQDPGENDADFWQGDVLLGAHYMLATGAPGDAYFTTTVRENDVAGVPEPGTMSLFVMGLAAAGAIRRRLAG